FSQPAGRRLGGWIFLSLVLPLLTLAALLFPGVAHAADEELDPTFGTGGVVRIAPQTSSAKSHEVVGLVQTQNSIVAAVNLTDTTSNSPAGAMIMLLDADGNPFNPPVEVTTSKPSARYTNIFSAAADSFVV